MIHYSQDMGKYRFTRDQGTGTFDVYRTGLAFHNSRSDKADVIMKCVHHCFRQPAVTSQANCRSLKKLMEREKSLHLDSFRTKLATYRDVMTVCPNVSSRELLNGFRLIWYCVTKRVSFDLMWIQYLLWSGRSAEVRSVKIWRYAWFRRLETTLKMEVISSSEMLVITYMNTWRYSPEDHNKHLEKSVIFMWITKSGLKLRLQVQHKQFLGKKKLN
jgi:hypothetical protein